MQGAFKVLVLTTLTLSAVSGAMLGGFKVIEEHANDAAVEAARGVAEKHLGEKLGAAPSSVEVVSAERQVVAGTNYKLTLRVEASGAIKFFEAKIWEKLPVYGGAMELMSLEEVGDQAGAKAEVQKDDKEAGSKEEEDKDEFSENPEVDDAAAYAVQQLSSQSNSLFPFTLKKVLSAKVHKGGKGGGGGSGVTHHLRLQLSHGEMPDSVYEVEVANPGGSYQLQNSQQLKME